MASAMTNQDSGEIWSFSLTSGGIGATAMSLDAHYRAYFEPLASDDPLTLTTSEAFYHALASLFEKLGQNAGLPLAICLTACPTACFVDQYGSAKAPSISIRRRPCRGAMCLHVLQTNPRSSPPTEIASCADSRISHRLPEENRLAFPRHPAASYAP